MGEYFIRFVGLAHLELIVVLALHNRREVFGNVFVSCVGDQRFEVGAKRIVGERLFELVDHMHGFFVHTHFYLVALDEFDRVEKRVLDVLTAERDSHVFDKVRNRSVGKYAYAGALYVAFSVRLVHEFFKTGLLERGDLDDGNAEAFLEFFLVDLIAVLLYRVHHVERDDHRNVDFHNLSCQIQVTLEVGCVDDVDDAVGLFVEYVISRDDFLGGVRRQRVNTRKVDDCDRFGTLFVNAVAFVYRDARPVADVRGRTRKAVEQRGFAAVRVAGKCKSFHYFVTSVIVTHAASVLRRVSS